jgi:hypothetical protein
MPDRTFGNVKTMMDLNDEDLALAAKELGTTTKQEGHGQRRAAVRRWPAPADRAASQ